MKKYAVLNNDTKSVINLIVLDDDYIDQFLLNENESLVPATRSVQNGMIYDENTKTFPEVYEYDRLLDAKYEISDLIKKRHKLLGENGHLTEQELQIQLDYIDQLNQINSLETADEIRSQLDSLEDPPAIPPAPLQITQDLFRSKLTLTEKILWDNPETGTTQQTAVINTLKMEFPYYGVESMAEELDLLKQVSFFTASRVTEVTQALS